MSERGALRALDWRFLLPLPPGDCFGHLVLLGGAPGQAALAHSIGLAEIVSEVTPTPAALVDAIVVLRGGLPALSAALPALRPGGVVYYEAPRRTVAVSRLTRPLHALGLPHTTLYGLWPNRTVRDLYLPFDNGPAVRWYFHALGASAQSVSPLLARLARILTALHPALLVPLVDLAVVATQGRASEPPTFAQRAGLPSTGAPLLLTPGPHDLGRVAAFTGPAGAPRPTAVLKCWRMPAQNAATAGEQAVLSKIHAALEAPMRQTLPRPLGDFTFQRLRVGAESCAPGRSPGEARDAWEPLDRHVTDLRLAADWLTRFHCQAQLARQAWSQPDLDEWVDKPLAALAGHLPAGHALFSLFAQTRAAAQQLLGRPVPLVWVHWGFANRNLFRTDGRLFVIDWEAASPGPPLYDLHYYVIHWYLNVSRAQSLPAASRAVARLFGAPPGDDHAVLAAQTALSAYQRDVAFDPGFAPVFLVAHLAERVLGRLRRQPVDAAAALVTRSPYTHYLTALAARQTWLFREAHGS